MSEKPESTGIATTLESPEPWLRVVKAEVARETFDREYARRLRQAVRTHQKPGFRKGRTPKALVEREVGDLLRSETMEALIQRAWTGAVLEHRLAPLTDPALENLGFEEGEPLRFELKVEVRPPVEARDYEGLPVRRRAAEVADADVDEVVERLRESRAEYRPVDRAAADGDRLTVDLVPGDPDAAPGGGQPIADQTLVLGAESNMPAFNEGLAGAAAGDEREVAVAYPDDHPNEQLKGRTLTFACRVKEVAARELPEVDDAFAAAVEEGKNLLELRTEIRRNLAAEQERQVRQDMDRQLLEELIARNDVSLPPSMVERYLDSGLEEMKRRNAQMGRPQDPGQDAEYREAGRPHAETALRGMLLLEAIRRQEEIKVAPEEVDERIEEIAREHGFEVDRYREFVNSGGERDRLEFDLLERRTYDFLLSRAQIAEEPAQDAAEKE